MAGTLLLERPSGSRRRRKSVPSPTGIELAQNVGGLNRSVQHHLLNLFSKGGVYGTRKTEQAFH